MWLNLSLLVCLFSATSRAQDCLSRDYGNGGTVCVCNAEHCDTVPRPEPVSGSDFLIYTSNLEGLRFQQNTGQFQEGDASGNVISVESSEKYQTILGWGGAFTDATGINIASLEEAAQENLLRSYFAADGIEYSLCRVPIGGTDFSTHGYSYDDGEEDPELNNFRLASEDYNYKIPYIYEARALSNESLRLFASAWTAPKWMKTNGEYSGYGFLREDMYQVWADYFVRFLDSYVEDEITFWGITTGNEPNTVFVPGNHINVVGWFAENQSVWIGDYLGPTIKSSSHPDIKILALDDQRVFMPWWLQILFESNNTRQYVDGIAFHWYSNVFAPARLIDETHELFPEFFFLSTEACQIDFGTGPVVLGSWARGEYYSIDIIQDMHSLTSGWVDWNMALDLSGGPTYIDNFVDSPIIVNATAGEFYKQPMFYHLGHFSKFAPRDSVRVGSTADFDEHVTAVAFQRPDDGIALVILNRNNGTVPVTITDGVKGTASIELSARSINTVLYWY